MQKFKRIGLGFSALVMSLSTALMPAMHAHATEEGPDNPCSTTVTGGTCVSDWAGLSGALKDDSIKVIGLGGDIAATGTLIFNHGVTILGGNHTVASSVAVAMSVQTPEAIVLRDFNLDNPTAGGYGMRMYVKYSDGTFLKSYDVTLDNTTIRSNGYGIYDLASYKDYGLTAPSSLSIINGSKVEWINADGKPVENKTTDVAANTKLTDGYSYGLVNYGMKDVTWTIKDSEISGYRYASQLSGDGANGELTIEDSYLNASRSDIDVFSYGAADKHFTVDVKNSTLHGINLYGGSRENYANVLFEKGTSYVDMTFDNVEFTVYENDVALNNYFANQYAITNRAYGTSNTNTAVIKGNSSAIVSDEYLAKKVQFTSFQEEPTWGTDDIETAYESSLNFDAYAAAIRALGYDKQMELRSVKDEDGDVLTRWTENDNPANTGIQICSGVYSYNPKEFLQGDCAKSVVTKISNGYLVTTKPVDTDTEDEASEEVDDEETASANEEVLGEMLDKAIAAAMESFSSLTNSEELVVEFEDEDGEKVSLTFLVTDAETLKNAITSGNTIKAVLTEPLPVNYGSSESETRADLENLGYTFLEVYGIDVRVYVGDNVVGYLTELGNTVNITLDVSSIEAEAEGYERSYTVVRFHGDDDPEMLSVRYDKDAGTISFVSDKFSNYLVAYYDYDPAVADDDDTTDAPETGAYTVFATGVTETSGMAALVVTVAALMVLIGLAKVAIAKR